MYQIMSGQVAQRVHCLQICWVRMRSLHRANAIMKPISVKNSGNIDTFVRVILTRSWQDAEGKKNTSLSPDLIELNYLTDNGWVIAEDQSTPERTVLYYTKALPVGETTPALSDTIRVNESIARM